MSGLSSERVYSHLRNSILENRQPPGSFVTESEVAQKLGVSRTPVREALHRLAAQGFVDLLPNRGAQVRGFNDTELREMLEVRLAIENFAAETICKNGNRLGKEINDIIKKQTSLIGKTKVDEFIAFDRLFHQQIVQQTNNSLLFNIYDQLRDRQVRMGLSRVARDLDRQKTIVMEHKLIVERINQRDAKGAITAITKHLDAALRQLRGE